jgi:hypothetical protein
MSDDNWQMLRTNQLFVHDNCQKLLQIYHQKFETIGQSDAQLSSMVYLNKFKQIQAAQVAHHQMRGLKQSSLLQENSMLTLKVKSTRLHLNLVFLQILILMYH